MGPDGAREVLGEALDEELVFALAHGGDVGEAVVLVDEVGVGEGSVEAAGEDVEDGDAVACGEPVGDGEGEGEGGVVAVRGEDEDLHGLIFAGWVPGCPEAHPMDGRRC